jgi:hypothetical protein
VNNAEDDAECQDMEFCRHRGNMLQRPNAHAQRPPPGARSGGNGRSETSNICPTALQDGGALENAGQPS